MGTAVNSYLHYPWSVEKSPENGFLADFSRTKCSEGGTIRSLVLTGFRCNFYIRTEEINGRL